MKEHMRLVVSGVLVVIVIGFIYFFATREDVVETSDVSRQNDVSDEFTRDVVKVPKHIESPEVVSYPDAQNSAVAFMQSLVSSDSEKHTVDISLMKKYLSHSFYEKLKKDVDTKYTDSVGLNYVLTDLFSFENFSYTSVKVIQVSAFDSTHVTVMLELSYKDGTKILQPLQLVKVDDMWFIDAVPSGK